MTREASGVADASGVAVTRLVYERPDGRWTWRLISGDSEVLAHGSSQGFDTEKEARIAADEIIGGGFSAAMKKRRPRPLAKES
jgi:hypothetical protein